MSQDQIGPPEQPQLGTLLRELGDDRGRPPLPSEQILAVGQRVKRRRRAAQVGGALTACVALVVGASALAATNLFAGEPVVTATAASYLREVAGGVDTEENPFANRYWKVETLESTDVAEERVTSWETADASYVRVGDRKAQKSQSPPSFTAGFTRAELEALPADPADLRRTLIDRRGVLSAPAGEPVDEDLAVAGYALKLLHAPLKGEVRRSVLLLLADSTIAEPVGSVEDGQGRAGTAVDFSSSGETLRVVLDRRGKPLEISDGEGPPELRRTYLFLGGVDSLT